jgi:hypothetical protein
MDNEQPLGFLWNGLHKRLLDLNTSGYKDHISLLWAHYRKTILQKEALMQMIDENYTLLKKNGAIQRENQRWDVDINIDEEYQYIIDWIDKRLGDLDSRL